MGTNFAFETDWEGDRPRQGHTAGGCHPVPLRDPYVLWDSRNFVPTTFGIKTGGIYPGPLSNPTRLFNSTTSPFEVYWGPLFNEGTGGPKFDLHVYYDQPTGNQITGRLTAIKYYNFSINTLHLGTDWPLSWDDYEGEPCEAPFTTIWGLGHLGRDEDWGFFTECDWANARVMDNGSFFIDTGTPGDLGNIIYDSFGGNYYDGFDHGLDFYPNQPDPFGGYPELNNEIVTITVDPRCNESYVWVGTDLVISQGAGDKSGDNINRYFYEDNDCSKWETNIFGPFLYMEVFARNEAPYRTDGSDYVATPWEGVVGVAKFRGTPSLEDLQYWKEYFTAPAPFTEPISDPVVVVTDTQSVYPNPYRYRYTGAIQTYTVPPGVTNIRITCWGGGRGDDGRGGAGGMAEAEFSVTPGQQFDVYVGESAGLFGSTSGGWPNGGQSTNGNNNEGGPGSGSSHVIPQGGAFTDALVVGGAGGGVNEIGGSRSTPGTLVYAGDGAYPTGGDGNAYNGPPTGTDWGGRGGTQTAGGAHGSGGDGEDGDTDGQGQGGDATGNGNFFAFGAGSGGGGWHGGGSAGSYHLFGGGTYSGDGGGGSSYTAPSGTNANYVNAIWHTHGMVEILALHPAEDIG